MNLQDRDKRALQILAGAVILAGIVWVSTGPKGSSKAVVASTETVENAEKRLKKLREYAATAPAKQQMLKQLTADLTKREKGVLQAATVGQAQSQLLEVVKRVAKNADPPVEVRQSELTPPEPLGESYGMVKVTVSFECRIEQLVNMLADLADAPELVATDQLRVNTANPKQKTMPVRLTVAGVIPRRLVPARKTFPVTL
jgi:hypothetical protein